MGVWYATTTTENRKTAQGVISTAQNVIGCPLPPLEAIARSSCLPAITGDPLHPALHLFDITALLLTPQVNQVPHL